MKKFTFVGCLALVLLAFNTSVAHAQTLITGDIAGRVVDKTGAVVAGATLTLRSDADGSTQVVKSSSNGNFRFPLLRPGSYSIHEEGSGMSATVNNVAVNVGQATSIDIVVGAAGNNVVVEVNTNQPLLQSEDGNISTTFSTDQLTSLPIPGGDISNLPFSTPGVNLSNGAGYGNFTAFGLPSTSNLFTTNGSDLMDAYLNLPNSGASNNVLGGNELQEAAVVVNGYTGQYGRLSGAQVNFTTKSGSNQFHGNALYYYNGSVLNANDWFLNNTGTPRPHAVSNQWGASIGGPIWKDKLFFFADSEGIRYVLPSGASPVYLPSPQFAAASLANIAAKQPGELAFFKNVYGLYASAPGASRATPSPSSDGGCGDFAGTKVGNQTFGGGALTPCSITFTPTNNNINTEQLYSFRIDANLTKNDKINGRFKHDWGVQATSTDPINNAFSANSVQPEYEGQGNETHIFSANVVNTATIAGMYYSAIFGPPNFAAATAVFPTTFIFGDGDLFANLGGTDNTFPSGRNVATYQVTDDLSITHGRHSIKTGFNFRRYNVTNYAPLSGVTGSTTFASNTDFFNGIISANNAGTSSTTQAFPAIAQAHMAVYAIGVYVQDQIALTPKFNLTASLRFDRGSNPSCGNNCYVRLAAPFDSLTHGAGIPYNQSILTGNSNAINDVEKVTTQPRIGFAYTPFGSNGKTVIRGGAGLFSDIPVISVYSRFTTNAPNVATFTLTPAAPTKNPDGTIKTPGPAYAVQPGQAGSSYASLGQSNAAFQNGFHSGALLKDIQTAVTNAGSTFSPPNYTASTTNKLLNPKFAEYNLEIQQQVTRHDVLDINYVGNIGTDILFLNPTANAYAACIGKGTCPGGFGSLPTTQPDPRFTAVTTLTNNGHSNYNGVVASLRHQGGYGITAAINYTYSHSLDNTSNGGVEGYSFEGTYPQTQIDPGSVDRLNYGTSDYDNKHNLSANYVWLLPYRFHNMIEKNALEGWAISGTLYAKSGVPYSVVRGSLAGAITSSTNAGSVLGAFLSGGRAKCGNPNNTCLLTSQFASAANQYQYGFGNLSRNSFRGPDYFDTDMQLSKTTAVTERVKLKLGANFFNILNHPNFAPPINNLASSQFGTIQSDIPPVSSPYGNFQGAGVSGRLVQVMGGITF
jgi:Carboxypeptidase regulatory-like domain